MAVSRCPGCSGIRVHQLSHWWSLLHCTTQPFLRAGSPNSATTLSQVSTANHSAVFRKVLTAAVDIESDRAKLDVPEISAKSCMQKRVNLQLRIQRRICTSTILCLPVPSTLRTSMVHLTGCLQHHTALLATVNPPTPSNPRIFPIHISQTF